MSTPMETAEDFLRDFGAAARNNPLSAALIGMGVLWLVAGRGSSAAKLGSILSEIPDAARDTLSVASGGLRSAAGRASSGVSMAGEAVSAATSSAYSQAAEVGGKIADEASERFRALPDLGAEIFGSARSNLNEIFKAQPLALGVIGLGIGASIAAALPTTAIEESYMGETSNRLMSQSADFVGEKVDQAIDTAYKVADAVASEAEKQGLSVDGLKSAAGQVSQKVSRVAEAAVSSAQNSPGEAKPAANLGQPKSAGSNI